MPDALRQLLLDAADDRFPPSDGGVTIVPPDATTGLHAALSFTAHAVVATDRTADDVAACGVNGIEGIHAADTLRALAGPGGWIGVLDVVLVARGRGTGGTSLAPTDRFDDHHRVAYARDLRTDVLVLADERGLVTLGRGLGGRTELGFELIDDRHGQGHGRGLLADTLAETPEGEVVFASCAPGNARSLRALLAVGFRVIGGEVLLRPVR
ncbi:GNAT family N-acetyltransferase [Aquihabitans sp. McL0605]|uniref:GNAT family N-acetyltransferase n=1 Tax=Aquihabitans sp. McL0605 TaxID=3415671 RepID=UPI003CE84ADB